MTWSRRRTLPDCCFTVHHENVRSLRAKMMHIITLPPSSNGSMCRDVRCHVVRCAMQDARRSHQRDRLHVLRECCHGNRLCKQHLHASQNSRPRNWDIAPRHIASTSQSSPRLGIRHHEPVNRSRPELTTAPSPTESVLEDIHPQVHHLPKQESTRIIRKLCIRASFDFSPCPFAAGRSP